MAFKEKDNKESVSFKERFRTFAGFVSDHQRVIWPVFLIICVIVTIVIAIIAGRHQEEEVDIETATVETLSENATIPIPDVDFEVNAYPEINTLVSDYYQALVDGNMDRLSEVVSPVSTAYLTKAQEISKYFEQIVSIEVYTKPGPIADSYLVFPYVEAMFTGYSKQIPSLQTFYVCRNEAGAYYINVEEEQPQNVIDYISGMVLQDDFKDLSNKVSVEFNEMLASDPEFATYYDNLSSQLKLDIGQAIAENNAETVAETETEQETEEAVATAMIVNKVRTTAVVNVRASDSEKADKLGKAQIGEEYTVVEELANGWTHIDYSGQDGYIKSEYLEKIVNVEATETAQEDTTATDTTTTEQTTDTTTASQEETKYVTANTRVRLRKSESTTSEVITTLNQGDKVELIQKQADGWTKVKYEGTVCYVKSEYVD
ncbi:MAG: SH3 domain-containing protein [Lachnospiraceae bacterium]|nr:SH3 domain-containing protein [Lachnospiraceae bacterium]